MVCLHAADISYLLHLGKPQSGYLNWEGFYLTGPDRLNAIANCRQGEAADTIEQTSHRDFSFRLFRPVLFFSHFFTPFSKNFSLVPCFPLNWEGRRNIFRLSPLYLQKVHNLSVKKGQQKTPKPLKFRVFLRGYLFQIHNMVHGSGKDIPEFITE